MEHGISWLNYLPFYAALERFFCGQYRGFLGSQAVFQHVLASFLVFLIICPFANGIRQSLQHEGEEAIVPSSQLSLRNLIELAADALLNQMKRIIGPEYRRFFPVIASLALFIFCSNLLGLIPGFIAPTDNWNTTFACSFFVFIYYHAHGIRVHGMHHFLEMANPMGIWKWWAYPLMLFFFPLEILSHAIRPISLMIRLSTNIIADHAVLSGFLGLMPILVPIPFMLLGLLVAVIQTLVFILLTCVYLGLSVKLHEVSHEEDHGRPQADL